MDNTFSSSYKIKQQSTGLPQTNWTYILMQTSRKPPPSLNKFNNWIQIQKTGKNLNQLFPPKRSTNISQAEEETDLDVKLPASPKQSNGRSKGKKALQQLHKDTQTKGSSRIAAKFHANKLQELQDYAFEDNKKLTDAINYHRNEG
jgi:hypothetical protein